MASEGELAEDGVRYGQVIIRNQPRMSAISIPYCQEVLDSKWPGAWYCPQDLCDDQCGPVQDIPDLWRWRS